MSNLNKGGSTGTSTSTSTGTDDGDQNQNNRSEKNEKKYKGVRRRKWGKWVSEIRVPGTGERLWLGSYTTPEAAAVAHDVASYCLRGPPSLHSLNFPNWTPSTVATAAGVRMDMSPPSVQKAASDAAMAVDAQFAAARKPTVGGGTAHLVRLQQGGSGGGDAEQWQGKEEDGDLGISVGIGSSSGGFELGGGEAASDLNISVDDYLFQC